MRTLGWATARPRALTDTPIPARSLPLRRVCAPRPRPLPLRRYHAQVGEYKAEVERIQRELQEVKLKFFEQKRKEQAHRERTRHERTKPLQIAASEARASVPRFTGGGFSLQRR